MHNNYPFMMGSSTSLVIMLSGFLKSEPDSESSLPVEGTWSMSLLVEMFIDLLKGLVTPPMIEEDE